MRPNGGWSSSGTQNMQSSTGQYSTQAGEPAQPVQHSVMTASSLGFFLRAVAMPFERGSCFSSSGTIPGALTSVRGAIYGELYLDFADWKVVRAGNCPTRARWAFELHLESDSGLRCGRRGAQRPARNATLEATRPLRCGANWVTSRKSVSAWSALPRRMASSPRRMAVSNRFCCPGTRTLREPAKRELKTVKPLDDETCCAGSPWVYGCGEGGFFSRPFRSSFFKAAMRLLTSAFCSGVNNS